MESYLSSIVHPRGWLEWHGTDYLDTLEYGEYGNFGPGAEVAQRVKWHGYHTLKESEAQKFTVHELIDGDLWLPATGINYTSGL
jgi:pectinesterase